MSKRYFVYIMASRTRTLYVGVTGDLYRRVYQHKHKSLPGFTARYNVTKLVHFEETDDVRAALAREKQVKAWSRAKRVALIESGNPSWNDLSSAWYPVEENAIPPDLSSLATLGMTNRAG